MCLFERNIILVSVQEIELLEGSCQRVLQVQNLEKSVL